MDWYHGLTKSTLTPHKYVFPVIWSLLYGLLALVGHFFWKKMLEHRAKRLFIVFLIQIVLNWIWTPIFFGLHLTGPALLDMLAVILITLYIVIESWNHYPVIAYIMSIYLLWLFFAFYLNFVIWIYTLKQAKG
jgi:tryptophan-rich sensory protein